jgi:hypothetical protein
MTDEKTKPESPEKTAAEGVDPESVRIEDMQLSEQQLRIVSGGKGYGRGGIAVGRASIDEKTDVDLAARVAGQ